MLDVRWAVIVEEGEKGKARAAAPSSKVFGPARGPPAPISAYPEAVPLPDVPR